MDLPSSIEFPQFPFPEKRIMIRTTTAAIAALALIPAVAQADVMASTGWEDTSADAVFGTFGNVGSYGYSSDPDPVYDGNHSLHLTESPVSGTPNAVVAWVSGIEAGDTITATIWFLGMDVDTGASSASKGRLWGGYYDSTDTSDYNSSAGGASGYAGTSGWESMTYTWTSNGNTDTFGLQVRIYSYGSNDQLWADNLEISTSNDSATIEVAGVSATPVVPGPVAGLAMLAGVVGVRRRRR